jgi:primosomal protein N''
MTNALARKRWTKRKRMLLMLLCSTTNERTNDSLLFPSVLHSSSGHLFSFCVDKVRATSTQLRYFSSKIFPCCDREAK